MKRFCLKNVTFRPGIVSMFLNLSWLGVRLSSSQHGHGNGALCWRVITSAVVGFLVALILGGVIGALAFRSVASGSGD